MNQLARALISGAAGCAGAIVTGGKCAQAAVTAAFASLYNGDRANLGRAFIGTDAQYTLNGKLQEYFPNGNLDHNTTLGGLFGDGRPDWVLDRSSVFNLTTERNSDGAAKDLDRYIETARQKGQTIGIGDANMLLRDGPIVLTSKGFLNKVFGLAPEYTFFASKTHPGVINYTFNNPGETAAAFAIRVGLIVITRGAGGRATPVPRPR